jgi:hypothetical protein
MANDTTGLIQIIGGGLNGATTLKILSGGTLELDSGSTITHAGVDLIDEIAAANGMDQTEFGYVNGSSTTVTASKCVVADSGRSVATVHDLTLDGNLIIGTTTLSEAELGVLDGVTAGTAAAGKALVLSSGGAITTITSATITTLTAPTVNATNIDAGASGTAGTIDVFPATAANGKLQITCAAQGAGNATSTLQLDAFTQATLIHIPNPGAVAAMYLAASTNALSLAEMDVLYAVTPGTIAATKAVTTDSLKTTRYGGFNTGAATTDAIDIAVATDKWTDGQLDVFSVFGASKTDMGGAYSAKCGRFRHVINGITASHETYGLVGQIVGKNVTFAHLHAGLMGTFECNTALTVSAGDLLGCAGIISRVGGATITVGATGVLAGVLSTSNATVVSVTSGGVYAAFACRKVGSGIRFEQALHIEDALVALSFKAAASGYDHGVAAKTATLSSNTSHAIKVMVGTTAGYIPVYAADTW